MPHSERSIRSTPRARAVVASAWLVTALITLSARESPGQCVAVTEILANPDAASDATGEWFEVVNYSTTLGIDIDGWVFSDSAGQQSFTVDQTLVIAPGAFLLLGRSGDPGSNGGIQPDLVYGPALPLSNAGDTIMITTEKGLLVDRVAYSGAQVEAGVALACEVGHRQLNDAPERWFPASTPFGQGDAGTPGRANEAYEHGPCAAETAVEDTLPGRRAASAPSPNPGRPPFTVPIRLAERGRVRAAVHDVSGRRLRTLADRTLAPGHHRLVWDGRDERGRRLPAGIYWILVRAGHGRDAHTLALTR